MKFYCVAACYFSQIEASAIVGLRFGFRAVGVALWPAPPTQGGRFVWPWWLPRIRVEVWAHTGQCDQRWLFRIRLGRHWIGYRTRGDASPNLATYYDAGWKTRWKPSRP